MPRFGYQGDIRFLGKAGAGLLPNDRTHQVKVYGTFNTHIGLNVGAGVNLSSGQPLTALAALDDHTRTIIGAPIVTAWGQRTS